MDLVASALPLPLLKPLPTPSNATAFKGVDEATKRRQIDSKAKEYEQSFLGIMFGQMFEGTTRTLFGGGEGEEAFTGFLTDAMAKSVETHGGVGLAKSLSTEMLKLQGLSPKPAAAAGPAATGPSSGGAANVPARTLSPAAIAPVTIAPVTIAPAAPAASKPTLDIAA